MNTPKRKRSPIYQKPGQSKIEKAARSILDNSRAKPAEKLEAIRIIREMAAERAERRRQADKLSAQSPDAAVTPIEQPAEETDADIKAALNQL